jgi:hypothetical protein
MSKLAYTLDVLRVLEAFHEVHDPAGRRLVGYRHRRLRHHREVDRLDRVAGARERLADGGERLGSARHDEARTVELDVVRARVGRRQHEVVLVRVLGGDEHDAAALEEPGDCA